MAQPFLYPAQFCHRWLNCLSLPLVSGNIGANEATSELVDLINESDAFVLGVADLFCGDLLLIEQLIAFHRDENVVAFAYHHAPMTTT